MPAGALAAPPKHVRLLAVALTVAALGGCSQVGDLGTLSPLAQGAADTQTAATTDPGKAMEASAKALVSNPRDLKAQLAHARNLKQAGDKSSALAVLQAASEQHGNDRELASEYGRLAADLDQLSLASKLLTVADDPARPDWRVISARGTVLAKQGRYDDALPLFERALALDPGNPSLINNLALARAASGDATGAESLLRQAAAARPADTRIRNNLALVEKLQGRAPSAAPAAAAPAAPVSEPVRTAVAAPAPRPTPSAPPAARSAPTAVQPTPVVARAPEPTRAPTTSWQTATVSAPPPAPVPVPVPTPVVAAPPSPAPVRMTPPAPAVAAAPVQAPSPAAPAVAGWNMRVAPAPAPEVAPPAPPVAQARMQTVSPPSAPLVVAAPPAAPNRPVIVGWSADVASEPAVQAPMAPPVALVAPAAEVLSRPVDLPSPYWRPVRK